MHYFSSEKSNELRGTVFGVTEERFRVYCYFVRRVDPLNPSGNTLKNQCWGLAQ